MYLIDANVLIEAKNRYYAFDIAPGFWGWLDAAHRNQSVCSIEAVHTELTAGNDELADWARNNSSFFHPIDQGTTRHFGALTRWAQSRAFTPAALTGFTSNHADFLLIAYAMEHQHTLITHERPRPNARSKIFIPDACLDLDVKFSDTFRMLRESGARLELATPRP